MEQYGDLKIAISQYLYERKDLEAIIPTLVALSERRIYRELRVPATEKVLNFNTSDDNFLVPNDYLEAKMFLVNGMPLRRISDLEYSQRRAQHPVQSFPSVFARVADSFYMHNPPDEQVTISLIYWSDLSGKLAADTDTNEILRIAPDLYVYGAMVEAMPYLAHDSRTETWNYLYNQAIAQINSQAVEAEYSGSGVLVNAVYGDN